MPALIENKRERCARIVAIGATFTFVLFLQLASLEAGTIRHDTADSSYTARAALPQFEAAGLHLTGGNGCSATLVGSQFVLTSAHCVDTNGNGSIADETPGNHTFSVPGGGGASSVAQAFYVPAAWNGDLNDGNDIAVMRLATPINSVAPAAIYRGNSELNATVTMVGYGATGDGQTGSVLASGTRRAGDNVVDAYAILGGGFATTTMDGTSRTGLVWDFDSPILAEQAATNQYGAVSPLALEYSIGPEDSGGGAFIFEGGQWWLAGISSGDADLYDYVPGPGYDRDTYGDANIFTRVSSYALFIDNSMSNTFSASVPEPSTFVLLLCTSLALGRRLRRRR